MAGDSDAGVRAEHARNGLAMLSPREHDVALAIGRGHANGTRLAGLGRTVTALTMSA